MILVVAMGLTAQIGLSTRLVMRTYPYHLGMSARKTPEHRIGQPARAKAILIYYFQISYTAIKTVLACTWPLPNEDFSPECRTILLYLIHNRRALISVVRAIRR